MPIPPRELALHVDAIEVFSGLTGAVARNSILQSKAMLAEGYRRTADAERVTEEDRDEYRRQCSLAIREAAEDLANAASRVPANALFQVPLMLGQADYRNHELGPTPNLYASEIERISKYAVAAPRHPISDKDVADTLRVMAIARKLNVLESARLPYPAEGGIEEAFTVGGIFRRGRFYGPYDQEVMDRVHERLLAAGASPSDPRALMWLCQAFMSRWDPIVAAFFERAARCSVLIDFLSVGDLLETGQRLVGSGVALTLIARYSGLLWRPVGDLLDGMPRASRTSSYEQLTPLIAELPMAPGVSGATLRVAIDAPIVRYEDKVLLAAPHRLSGDATDLLGRTWAQAYGELYYKIRGAVVEEVAFEVLMSIKGARGIKGGVYTSVDGSVEGECDGVVLVGDILFVVEAKGGFISAAARSGSSEAARGDIRTTVSEAYFQAARLISSLKDHGHVTLRGRSDSLTIHFNRLQRIHVIIPTADEMSAIATDVYRLGEADYLPAGATPMIIGAQDLLLVNDAIREPHAKLAYFEFREETLRARPRVMVADEMEFLGAFVSGIDFVAHIERLHDRHAYAAVMPDMVLQRHVDAWLHEKFEKGRDLPPPRRHRSPVETMIASLARTQQVGAIDAYLASRDAGAFAMDAARGRKEIVVNGEICVAAFDRGVDRRALLKNASYRRAKRTSWQLWTMSTSRDGRISLNTVLRRPTCAVSDFPYASCASEKAFTKWVDNYRSRRRSPPDAAHVRALEDLGVPRSLAGGVTRRGLGAFVYQLIAKGVQPTRAAAFCVGPASLELMRSSHEASAVAAVSDAMVRVLDSVQNGLLSNKEAEDALRLILSEGTSVEDAIAAVALDGQPPTDNRTVIIEQFLRDNPRELERIRAGDIRAVRYAAGQIVRSLSRPKPEFRAVQEEVAQIAGRTAAHAARGADHHGNCADHSLGHASGEARLPAVGE
ncbi:GatB/YqeY domain-containing protein [Georgenia faecalis]|uniref:GatB/YqeY domain-containing protein n=1 Tax=Georgenia faecalis TaxID=2483799 RepID=UPI0013DFBF38|nr:GatB/YqeY domain-containing protein [Georgenia faecalis]